MGRHKTMAFSVIFYSLFGIILSTSIDRRNFTILEGRPPNTFVGNLSKRIVAGAGVPSEFKVDFKTGVITSTVALDREKQNKYSFRLFGKIGKDLGPIAVVIDVEDVNDEHPKFRVQNHTISIPEAYNVGDLYYVGWVSDEDEGLNSVQIDTVRILSGNVGDVFKLNVTKQQGGKHYLLNLVIAVKLRRRVRDKYVLNITASDKGNPVRTGYLLLTVLVEDFNDCAPTFPRSSYSAVVSESAPKATNVLNVTTTDCDFGENAEVKYEMNYARDNTRHFGIKQDGRLGLIQTNLNLDYEVKKEYKLQVKATDLGNPPKHSSVDIVVHIRDENDNDPEIITFDVKNIKEDAHINTTVASVTIKDKDSGENARLDVTVEPSDVFSFIKNVPSEGLYIIRVYLKIPLDREVEKNYKILVTAVDHGKPSRSNQNAQSLVIGDVNDNPPKFDQDNYSQNILESEKVGTFVLSIHATDPDSVSANSITYHIISTESTNYSAWFGINSTSGLIYVASGIDHEKYSKVILVVQARDGGMPEYSANCTVLLNILDINDNAPEFSKLDYSKSVAENGHPGIFVLQIDATDKDNSTNGSIVYSFDPQLPPPNDVFSLNKSSGIITVLQKLDREIVSEYHFGVIAQDEGGLTGRAKVNVKVEDVNDNNPFFYPDFYNLSLLENTTVGSDLVQLQAHDNDTGWNAQISYDIISGDKENTFHLNRKNGLVTLQKNLNREKVERYILKFRAIDNGGLTSLRLARVEILVQDVNDDPPKFGRNSYKFFVLETIVKPVYIGTVSAKSCDEGLGGIISYSIKTPDTQHLFSINSSGVIFSIDSLDRENQSSHMFTVEARDYGDPPLYGYVNVSVIVEDVNDNSPVWSNPNITVNLMENQNVGKVFHDFSAFDKDAGKNGEVTYSITSGPRDVFYLNPKTGGLSLVAAVDYEQVQSYKLIVNASDSGTPSQSSLATVDIFVLDCNDNAPVLNESHIRISEDEPIGSKLFTFHAEDQDSGTNGQIWYKLDDSSAASNFELNKSSGELTLQMSLDREKHEKHVLYVLAGDFGKPFLTSKVKFTVFVEDVNDETPTFLNAFKFVTTENEKAGTIIGILTATDRDEGLNAKLQYSLLNSTDEFEIESKAGNGILRNKVQLDRETSPMYSVNVQVSDKGEPSRSNTTTVHVSVKDVNDNAPEFPENPYRVNVPENVAKGTTIEQVKAYDRDEGLNGSVVYLLNTGNIQGGVEVFQINRTTGVIFIVAPLDRESKAYFVLSIVANDEGHPSHDAITNVFVTVVDVNDHKPAFKVINDSISIPEKLLVGSLVYTANATDPDEGENGNIVYSIISTGPGEQMFRIDRNSGAIFLDKALDYETTTQYALRIRASDNAKPSPKQSFLKLYVNVLDSNDNSPSFPKNPIFTSVKEGVPRGTEVHRPIVATDLDSGINSRIYYSIVSQTPKRAFEIDNFKAQLTTDVQIDREDVDEYTLIIKAQDQAVDVSEQLSSTVTVQIIVLDINDCAPIITSRDKAFVMEDEPLNYTVFKFTAEDKDSGEGGKVVFSIVNGNSDGIFGLDPSWGSLILQKELDREKVESYTLVVKATDQGDPSLSTKINFTISVEDVNDNKPQFSSYMYQASVEENENNTAVLTVVAKDADSGSRGELFYSIPAGITDGLFTINQTSGVISTTSPLDREKDQRYQLTVYVRDNFYPNYTSTTTVEINVTDKNDNKPFFLHDSFKVEIPENSPPGFLHSLVAQDMDDGANARLIYSIESGNEEGLFTVFPNNGTLATLKPLDREKNPIHNLVVKVRDSGDPVLSTSVNVTVNVLDENDNPPRFASNELNVSVAENSLPGTSVVHLTAVDDDESSKTSLAYSFGRGTEVPFGLDSTSGLIYTLNYLNASEVNTYQFSVIASDGSDSGVRNQSIIVNVFVDDTMSIPLRFTEVFYKVHLNVSVIAGIDILQLQLKSPSVKPGDVEYRSESGQTVLTVGPAKGNVRFATTPDRGAYMFSVRATLVRDPSNTAVCFVLVTVKDSSPRPGFTDLAYWATLDENSPADTFVVKLRPKTAGNVTFQLINGNEFNAFQINSYGEITVDNASALDYERSRNFELDVKGDWGNIVTNIAFVKVYISIRNLDDKAPIFRQNVFISSISESVRDSVKDGRLVAKLHTFDFGNFQRSFAIVSGNSDNVFSLSRDTGELRLQKPVDRENRALYNLTVVASREKLSSKCIVLVFISDMNDNPPKLPTSFSFNVSENSPRGSTVGQIKGMDLDESSVLRYSFADGKQQHKAFITDLFTGTLTLADMIDYETAPTENSFEVIVTDGRSTARTHVSVTTLDHNDNKPQFQKPFYHIQPKEVVPVNYSLGQVNATDKDEGINSKIVYSMTPVDGITIDSDTGIIFNTKPLKYDPFRRFIDTVITARDQGLPPLLAKVPFRIRILDSDNPPKFENVSYDVKIPENTVIGTSVVTIKAVDSGPSSSSKRISYRISRGDDMGKFSIEERTGVLRVRAQLDRETTERYTMFVEAKDKSDPKNVDQIAVRITIEDVNDNAPIFQPNEYYTTSGNESMYTTRVIEDAKLNTKILIVFATDKDNGSNKEIRYSISSGNDGGWFSIDKSGELKLIVLLDRDSVPIHRLSVRATDQGDPPKASEISVVIKVGDINDNAPKFIRPKDLGVDENAPIGSPVGIIKATDSDSDDNQLIHYTLINGTGLLFDIKPLTGELTTKTVFDYENKSSYSITIKAEDQGTPHRSSILPAVVQIRSVDEYEPKFFNKSYSFNVPGNSKKGDIVGQVHAVDADGGPDGVIIYELVSPVEPFAVNISSGELYLTEDFVLYKRSNRRKRDTVESSENVNQTLLESYALNIKASSGRPGSKNETVTATMYMDYRCPGCYPTPTNVAEHKPSRTGTMMILVVTLSVVGFLVCCFILICIIVVCRRKERVKNKKVAAEVIGLHPVGENPYRGKGLINPYSHVPSGSLTNSQASASSSSGHGSSEGFPIQCDVVIPNCDKTSSKTKSCITNPDSGVHIGFEGENLSHGSGLDISDAVSSEVLSDRTDRLISHLESRESLHEFDDEGGREASGGVDVGNLLYAKLAEADAEEDDQNVDRPRVFKDEGRPDYTGSLSSILGSHEELRGHYNYFYSMNQSPQYQPLSEVFSEIGRLPVQDASKNSVLECSPNGENMSGRTSLLSSVSSLHNQHLDPESTYSSLPMTPNFTPAMTPLVTRSPSLSPLTSEVVTPLVSPSTSRPSSMYLLTSRPSSSLIQLAEKGDGLEENFHEDITV